MAKSLLALPACQTYPCVETLLPQPVGVTAVGSLTDTDDSGYLNGIRVTTSALGGRAISLSLYTRGPLDIVGHRNYQIGLYSDTNGVPGRLLGTTPVGTLTANAWSTRTITALTLAPSTSYWIMANNNGTVVGTNRLVYELLVRDNAGAWSQAPVAFGTWPTTFIAELSGFQFSMYATVVP